MEHYKILIELQGHIKSITTHRANIESQNSRLDLVNKHRTLRENSKNELIQKKSTLHDENLAHEKTLFKKEKDLEKANGHLTMVTNDNQIKALEKEVSVLTPLIDSLQENVLENMETIEGLEQEITDCTSFIEGSLESLKELTLEVDSEVKKENQQIENYQSRAKLLLESLETNQRSLFLSVKKTVKDHQVVAFLQGKNCSRCKFEAPSSQVTEVENGRSLELCSNCGRILVPATINAF
ncbi:hypothetical protein A9Q84_19430 [Halobacteriovorax marinus]|uniref:C4-type zinc ribbon domain-containing protein n=1 Tax=Halobacteriovorax marinus TaxID=97084 RepID=A0A1Y5F2V6_9BACT|nr:hypothetical protein A9Q84_19430 [Halobacteriovorax marinus]